MGLFLKNKRFNFMLFWGDYYLRWWRLPIEERACWKTDLGGSDYYLRNSGLPPSSHSYNSIRNSRFTWIPLPISIRIQLSLYSQVSVPQIVSIYIQIQFYISREWFRALLVRKPRNNYYHTVIKAESNTNWVILGSKLQIKFNRPNYKFCVVIYKPS